MDFIARTHRHDRVALLGAPGRCVVLALVVAAMACGPALESPTIHAASGEWLEFEGSWNATGKRRRMTLGAHRQCSLVDLRGTMLLAGANRPGVGFHSEVIALGDSVTGLVGRSIWTDERGDQVFIELQGEGTAATNHITGTIVGGTGRYADATGTYEFSWEWVLEAEEGAIQGRAVDLKGRVRAGSAAGESRK